jgi:peptidoglycan/xylan/chitin deacetylase (PgdA/CDA1 family)
MKMLRTKEILLNTAERFNLLRLAQFPLHEAGNHLFVLAYHRVAETNNPLSNRLYDLVCASPRQFDEQMRLLSTCFHPVSAEDVLNALNGGKSLPAQAVLVTVDDGYRDFKETIFPITQKYGIRPVLFVPTAYVGDGIFWWDRLFNAITNTDLVQVDTLLGNFSLQDKTARQIAFDALANHVRMQPFENARGDIEKLCERITPNRSQNFSYTLNWDELRSLSAQGVTIASHTHNHPILTHIPMEKARDEIRISLDLIKQQIGQPLPIFAYPDGRDHAVNKDLTLMLKEEGIQLAFTMSDQISRLKQDNPQLFPRLIPYHSISLPRFHLLLTSLRAARNN